MAGHVHRHGNGWRAVVVDGYGRGAKKKVVGTWRLKADAENELRKAEAEMMTGTFVDRRAGKVSLADRMAQDIARRSDRAHGTTGVALNSLEHVKAYFGNRSINAIKPSDLQAFVSQLDLAPSTVATVFQHVTATFRLAVDDAIIGRDPTRRVKLPKVAGVEMVIPTDSDVELLHVSAPEGFGAAIVLGAGVGLRAQEAAGVCVDDIDFLRREINIRRQWHAKLDEWAPLKSEASTRTIPVGDDILSALAAHIERYGTGQDGVLLQHDGEPLHGNRMAWRWNATKKRAGRELRFHDLRHHFASTAISAGVPLPALSKALGHSKASITLDVYGHLMVNDSERLRSAITACFAPNGSTMGAPHAPSSLRVVGSEQG